MRPLYEKNALVVAAAGNENIDVDNVVDLGYTYVPCVTPVSPPLSFLFLLLVLLLDVDTVSN